MDPRFLKWIAVVAIAVFAAGVALWDHIKSRARKAIEDDLREKESEAARKLEGMTILHADLRDVATAMSRAHTAEPSDLERVLGDAVITINAVRVKLEGNEASISASDGLTAVFDVLARINDRLSAEMTKTDEEHYKVIEERAALAIQLGKASSSQSFRLVIIQMLTVVAIAVSAFPVGKD